MKYILTSIAGIDVEYGYKYSPGTPARIHGRPEDCDHGSGPDITLEGPYVGGEDISGIVDLIPIHIMSKITDAIYEQIELAESNAREDARHAADEDRYERSRDERDGV